MAILPDQFVKTDKDGLIELTMPDRSMIRLSADTIFQLMQAYFPDTQPSKVTAKLFLGRLWAKIVKRNRKKHNLYNIQIPTAILGVRGTVYDVKAAADKSADIYVYEGIVGVGPPLFEKDGRKEEVAWPTEVSEKQWEEIILKQLNRLHIGSDGKPGKPASFDPEKVKDDWVTWNQKRDILGQ